MVPDVSTGSSTLGLINYLFGPGRRDEHTAPHIVAAWDMAGAPTPAATTKPPTASSPGAWTTTLICAPASWAATNRRSTCGTARYARHPATATSPTPSGQKSPTA
jgi:hypothetical protein